MVWSFVAHRFNISEKEAKQQGLMFLIVAAVSVFCHLLIVVLTVLLGGFSWFTFLLYTAGIYGALAFIFAALFISPTAKRILDDMDH
jgi:hypothetical protein